MIDRSVFRGPARYFASIQAFETTLSGGWNLGRPLKKILCIEDDDESASLIADELVDRGFDVSIARDGQDGLLAILKEKPDLVLSDVGLPRMSGFEVLERLNDIAPRFGRIPFVFLTALTDRGSELKGRLNDREIEVLTWVARGKTSQEIAGKLRSSKRTIDFHIDNARVKLGAPTRTAAAIKAAIGGLIKP